MTKHIQWDGTLSQEGFDILKGEGGCIVCPTKVGYIIMTSDKAGLERKFEAKERNRNKPGVYVVGVAVVGGVCAGDGRGGADYAQVDHAAGVVVWGGVDDCAAGLGGPFGERRRS